MASRTQFFKTILAAVVVSVGLAACGASTISSGGDTASQSPIEIRSPVGGTIDRIGFAEGSRVRKGQILFRIDPTPFRAETERRFIARNHAIAELEMARAARARALRLPGQTRAADDVAPLEAAVKSATAALAEATRALNASKVDLQSTEIRAPIDGLISSALSKQGAVIPAASLLTTIVSDGADPNYLHATARASL
jgi:multidrug efflux system membrane fusion protein